MNRLVDWWGNVPTLAKVLIHISIVVASFLLLYVIARGAVL